MYPLKFSADKVFCKIDPWWSTDFDSACELRGREIESGQGIGVALNRVHVFCVYTFKIDAYVVYSLQGFVTI
jgi:hypothetical protein